MNNGKYIQNPRTNTTGVAQTKITHDRLKSSDQQVRVIIQLNYISYYNYIHMHIHGVSM